MKSIKALKALLVGTTLLVAASASASGGGCGSYEEKGADGNMVTHHYACEKAPIDFTNKASLQRGASTFMSYCVGCHSAKYVRYSRMADDLEIPRELVQKYMMFTGDNIGEQINPKIDPKMQAKWFGAAPPDLSLESRLRGDDWVYTYLLSFYQDPSRPWGVNNIVLKNAAMPHVLYDLQQQLSQQEYEQRVGDLVNFMAWMGEPVRHDRKVIGAFVLLFLLVLLIPVYFLNREYWKDVK